MHIAVNHHLCVYTGFGYITGYWTCTRNRKIKGRISIKIIAACMDSCDILLLVYKLASMDGGGLLVD